MFPSFSLCYTDSVFLPLLYLPVPFWLCLISLSCSYLHASIYMPVRFFICMCVCLSFCVPTCLPIYLSVWLSVPICLYCVYVSLSLDSLFVACPFSACMCSCLLCFFLLVPQCLSLSPFSLSLSLCLYCPGGFLCLSLRLFTFLFACSFIFVSVCFYFMCFSLPRSLSVPLSVSITFAACLSVCLFLCRLPLPHSIPSVHPPPLCLCLSLLYNFYCDPPLLHIHF